VARANGRIPPLKINGMFAEENDSESESDEVPKIQIRKVKKSSVCSGESVCGHSDNSARSSNSSIRTCHSPYTYRGWTSATADSTGAFVPNDCLATQHLTPDFDCDDTNTDTEYTDVHPNDGTTCSRTCDHHQSWKRLRHKRGISYFVCTECGRRWRKMNANATKEFGCIQHVQSFPQPMFAMPMSMPAPMYACAYPFACYYPTYTQ